MLSSRFLAFSTKSLCFIKILLVLHLVYWLSLKFSACLYVYKYVYIPSVCIPYVCILIYIYMSVCQIDTICVYHLCVCSICICNMAYNIHIQHVHVVQVRVTIHIQHIYIHICTRHNDMINSICIQHTRIQLRI